MQVILRAQVTGNGIIASIRCFKLLPDQKAIGTAYQAFDENGNLKDALQQAAIEQLGSRLATVTTKLNA